MRFAAGVMTATLLSACAVAPERAVDAPAAIVLPQVHSFSRNAPGNAVPLGWRPWTLSRLKKPTQYELVSENCRTVVNASAKASASGLVHPLALDPARYPILEWRWKVTQLIPKADNTRMLFGDAKKMLDEVLVALKA
jgi:hypothetical protein